MMGRIVSMMPRICSAAVVWLVLVASPAAADPARPGEYTSTVTEIDPDIGGFTVEVYGGDSFVEVNVEPGVELVVLGYQGEPYLRFAPEGGVAQNANSTATYLNDDRYGRVAIPDRLAGANLAELEPDWTPVADGHHFAWHDHRSHWMAPNAPPAVERGESFDWSGPIRLLVDGTPVEVSGSITYEDDISPLPWILGIIVAAVAVGFAARSRPGRWRAALVAVVAAAAGVVSYQEFAAAPSTASVSPVSFALACVGAALAVLALTMPPRVRPLVVLASAITLASWAVFRFAVLTNPVLITPLDFTIDRAVTAAALAVTAAIAPIIFVELASPTARADTSTPASTGV